MPNRHRSGFTQKNPVKYEWSAIGDTFNTAAIPAKILGGTGAVATVPQTVVRWRGLVGVTLDAGAVDESLIVRCGIILVTPDAFATGIGAIPGPGSDRDQSWLWTGQAYLTSGAEAAIVPDQLSAVIPVDSKAMRKVKPNETFAFVVEVLAGEFTDQGGTLDFIYALDILTRTN